MSSNSFPGTSGPPAPEATGLTERPLSRGQKFRMVVKVVELRLRFIALMAVTGLVFAYWDTLWNYYDKWTRPPGQAQATASDTEFYCPMHPTVVQDAPSTCPICGMPLSKRQKGQQEVLPEGVTARLALAPFRVAQAGIRTEEVAYAPLAETLTTVGTVETDERRHAHITSRVMGKAWIETLYVNFIGQPVKAGEPLAEVYSPELYSAAQELLTAQRFARRATRPKTALGRSVADDPNELVLLAAEKLKLFGLEQEQIDRILREGKADYRIQIKAPIGGVVFEQFVVRGKSFEQGADLFDVVDLGVVWVKAQVYADRLPLVRVGQEVEATVETFPGEVFRGRVTFIDPKVDPMTRTVTVRYDLDNSDLRLKPGMYATVALKTPSAETPLFQARLAKTGGGTTRLASLTAAEQESCPVTGLKLGSMGDPVTVEVQGRGIWTCCDACPPEMKASPAKYLARLAPAPAGVVLTVPESAVIDTGSKKVVYIEAEPGVFEGREVVLGPRSGERYPVLDGLSPGEKVAAAGSFLIDAETRLNPGRTLATEATEGTERKRR